MSSDADIDTPNYKAWARMPNWTVLEAGLLAVGQDPHLPHPRYAMLKERSDSAEQSKKLRAVQDVLEPDRKVVEPYRHIMIHRLCSEDGGPDALERYRSG